jgi:hypothetical protein
MPCQVDTAISAAYPEFEKCQLLIIEIMGMFDKALQKAVLI